jgi:hypothetical protein
MLTDLHPLGESFFDEHDDAKPKLAPEALLGIAGEFVRRTLPQTEADPVGLLINFLMGASTLFGGEAVANACGRQHPPTDFAVCVGKTGQGRKGTASGHAMAVMNLVDGEFENLHVIRGLASGEGLVQKMQDRSQKMIIEDRRFLCLLPEFGSLLEVMTRQGNTLSYCLRQAWDGDPLHVTTRKNSLEMRDFQLSIIGHITPDELLNGLSHISYMNGFANRFLFLRVTRSQYLPEGGQPVDYSDIARRLRQIVANAKGRGVLHRTEEAKELWARHYERLSTPPDNLKGALSSRAEAHCLRLSVLYALLDDALQVEVQHVRAALALWAYAEASIADVFGARLGDPDAEKILDALARGPLNATELLRVFSNNRSSEWLLAKLRSMTQKGLIVETTKTGDRKTVTAWTIKK